ncbi:MAG TPA: insulinase family protein [Bacteroidales bacterium]|nr:insulinase family protein [Bacteroidales bacterium]
MTSPYIPGNIIHGFRLAEKRFVREVNAECLHFRHEQSGARLLKILSDDPNKTFCIGFKTLPSSDNGVPHIMEHSVLNGSRNFPVKSPFDVLLKGSLSTFLNAFTSKDYTMYPVASMNRKDYFNLMHVYLDAVFNPLIYDDPRIFMQEGWHYELSGHDAPLQYTGVVYNEMKGSFSNPQRELWYQVFRHLFPANAYGYESGGLPEAIPTLTQEEFLAFHRKYYHPDNSYIFLYGDADLEEELAFLDEKYLSAYHQTENRIGIPEQPPFGSMKTVTERYAVLEGSELRNQTFLTYNLVAGKNTDLALTLALDVLCEVLVNQEAAPVRLALMEAGIGQEVTASSSNFLQHSVQIAALNANPEDLGRFREIIVATLRKAVADGIDKKEIEGVINRFEFRLREGDDAQKGLTYLNMALPRWFFADDPIAGLEYEIPLAEVKKALITRYLEDLVERYFIDNPHTLLLSLEPDAGLDRERANRTEAALASVRGSLDPAAEAQLIRQTAELVAHQQREDTPEALAAIPMLQLSDIDPKAVFYGVNESTVAGIPLLIHETFTNHVVYLNLYFGMDCIPQELIPYTALLAGLMGSLGTENYSYGDLNRELNIHTGRFFTSLRTFLPRYDDSRMAARFTVASKAMNYKTDKLFALTSEIVNRTRYDDLSRLKNVIARHHSMLDAEMKGNGYQVASRRHASYTGKAGMFGELTAGLSYYRFVSELMQDLDGKAAEIAGTLQKVAGLLFRRGNMTAAMTGEAADRPAFDRGLATLATELPVGTVQDTDWRFPAGPRREGLLAASNVQYVIKGYNYRRLGYDWDARMRVLNQVLSTDWLQTQIRVVGGAYGGFSHITPGGELTLNSYRDPNLGATLENFDATPRYLENFTADETTMTRYIIGTIAEMDTPRTPSQRGEQAFALRFAERTAEEVQRDRDAVLSTTPADLRGFAPLVREVLEKGAVCVYGSAERLKSEAEHFDSLVAVTPAG